MKRKTKAAVLETTTTFGVALVAGGGAEYVSAEMEAEDPESVVPIAIDAAGTIGGALLTVLGGKNAMARGAGSGLVGCFAGRLGARGARAVRDELAPLGRNFYPGHLSRGPALTRAEALRLLGSAPNPRGRAEALGSLEPGRVAPYPQVGSLHQGNVYEDFTPGSESDGWDRGW